MRRLLIILFLFATIASVAQAQFARQPENAGLSLENVALGDAVARLSQLYRIDILYADDLLQGQTVTASIASATIEEALAVLLKDRPISFAREGDSQIVLYKKERRNIDVYGWVLDAETGETLPYANIYVPGTGLGTTSNSDGRFRLAQVPADVTTLSADYMGYTARTIALESSNLTPNLLIRLSPSVLQTESVTVKENSSPQIQFDARGSGLALSTGLFRQLPMMSGSDAIQALHFMAGVGSSANATTALNIRGGLPSENLITLDGIALYHTDHAFGVLSTVPTSVIKDIRIHKNAFPARFGGRTSAVVEMSGKTGDFNTASVDVEANLMATQGMLQMPISDWGSMIVSGRHSLDNDVPVRRFNRINQAPPFMDNFVQTMSPQAATAQARPDIRFYDLYSKLSVLPGKNDLLYFTLIKTEDRMENNNTALNGLGSRLWQWSTEGLSANWYRVWNRSWQSKLMLSYSSYSIGQTTDKNDAFRADLPQAVRINNRLDERRLFAGTEYSGWNGHLLSAGFERSQVETDFNEWHPQYEDILEHGIEGISNAVFVEDRWDINERLRLTSSLRATHFDLTDQWYYSPRVSLAFMVNDALSLKSAFGRYHQFVNSFGYEFPNYVGQLSWLVSDGGVLKPSSSDNAMAGFTWETALADVDLELFRKDADGLIEQINTIDTLQSPPILSRLEQRSHTVSGLDLMLRREFGRVGAWLSYSYNDAGVQSNNGNYNLPGLSPQTVKLVSTYSSQNWRFSASWQWAEGRYYSTPQFTRVPDNYIFTSPAQKGGQQLAATQRLDASIDYNFQAGFYKIAIGSSFYNLLDRKNIWYKSFEVSDGELKSKNVFQDGFTPNIFLRLSF